MNEFAVYVAVFLLGVFIASCSQILLKKSATITHDNIRMEYLNWRVITAYGMFGLSAVMNMYILRYIPISLASILESAAYIYVPVLSLFILKERLRRAQIIGMVLVITGVLVFNL